MERIRTLQSASEFLFDFIPVERWFMYRVDSHRLIVQRSAFFFSHFPWLTWSLRIAHKRKPALIASIARHQQNKYHSVVFYFSEYVIGFTHLFHLDFDRINFHTHSRTSTPTHTHTRERKHPFNAIEARRKEMEMKSVPTDEHKMFFLFFSNAIRNRHNIVNRL